MFIQWINDTKEGDKNERQYDFCVGTKDSPEQYKAVLKDLPTLTETYKTLDRKSFYKSNTICQMLEVLEEDDTNDGFSTATTPPTFSKSGLSPATKDVHDRFHVPARNLVYGEGGRLPKHSTTKDTEKFLSAWLKSSTLRQQKRKRNKKKEGNTGESSSNVDGDAKANEKTKDDNSNSNNVGNGKEKQNNLRTVTRKDFVNKESYMNQLEFGEEYELQDADGNPLDGEILDDDTMEYIIANVIKKKKEEKERQKEQEEALQAKNKPAPASPVPAPEPES